MSHNGVRARSMALLVTTGLLAAACSGSDDDSVGAPAGPDGGRQSEGGGELIDLGTFVGDAPPHLDPGLNDVVEAYQVVNALFDGLTDIDSSDPTDARIVPHVAESYESNGDATVWTFTLRDDVFFSNGEQVLPSSFVRAWERASDPALAGPYSYLFNVIQGGAEKLEGGADSISGLVADDQTLTLTVSLAQPYANFDALVAYQTFFPVPSEVDDLAEPGEWDTGMMVGNGPYMLESPRTDQEVVLIRNDRWGGDFNGETWPGRLDRIEFRVSSDEDSAYNAFEAGEGDTANIPTGRVAQVRAEHGTTLDVDVFASYHFLFNERSPLVGGPQNQLFRQAISQAINRDEINEAVYSGSRTTATGVTPPGIPGATEGLCDYCEYDPEAARAHFQSWLDAGNSQTEPLPIQFNADTGHESVVQIVIDNLAAIGIEAVADPRDPQTYGRQLNEGACVFCRAGWTADYPAYDNFMYDLFHSDALQGNNYGYMNPEFDALVDQARATVDDDERADLFRQAERILLNEETGVVPINWYKGDYAYDRDKIAEFPQTPFLLVPWERVRLHD